MRWSPLNKAKRESAKNWMGYKYHDDERKVDVTYIHTGKTRIIENLYRDLKNGFAIDGGGSAYEKRDD